MCLLFAFRNGPIATPHGASEIHSRCGPDFKGIPPSNILRTRGSGRINSIQICRSITLRTWATLTKKSIAGRARVSAHSACKHSKDLLACPDQIHSDRGAAHREGVTNGCLQFRYPNWFSGSKRGVRSEILSARMWPPWYTSASSAAARASTRPSTTGSGGTHAICPCASACGGLFQSKRVLPNHVAPVLRSAEQRSARASTRPAATRTIRTYAHMVTRRFAPRDGLHFLVRAYGFTETLRRAAQREGVGMTACHGLGVYIGACGSSVSPYGGLPEPKRHLRILFLRRSVSPEWLPYAQIFSAFRPQTF